MESSEMPPRDEELSHATRQIHQGRDFSLLDYFHHCCIPNAEECIWKTAWVQCLFSDYMNRIHPPSDKGETVLLDQSCVNCVLSAYCVLGSVNEPHSGLASMELRVEWERWM